MDASGITKISGSRHRNRRFLRLPDDQCSIVWGYRYRYPFANSPSQPVPLIISMLPVCQTAFVGQVQVRCRVYCQAGGIHLTYVPVQQRLPLQGSAATFVLM